MSAAAHAALSPPGLAAGSYGPGQRPHSPKPGVDGQRARLLGPPASEVSAAALAAYMLASSRNFPMFFLYRILLLPNQLETWTHRQKLPGQLTQ